MTTGSMKTLITNRATLLSAVLAFIVAATMLGGHGCRHQPGAQNTWQTGAAGHPRRPHLRLRHPDHNTQILAHIVQIGWGAATADDVESFKIKMIAGAEARHAGQSRPSRRRSHGEQGRRCSPI